MYYKICLYPTVPFNHIYQIVLNKLYKKRDVTSDVSRWFVKPHSAVTEYLYNCQVIIEGYIWLKLHGLHIPDQGAT